MEPTYRILLPGVPASSARGALGWCNVVLLRWRGQNVLFDTGSYGDRQPLLTRLAACGLAPEDVDVVFASHFHYDHVANAEIFGCPLLVSERERRYAFDAEYVARHDPFVPRALVPFLGSRLQGVRDGDEIAPGLRTVALPGHTPGTTGLLLEDEGVLLAGDAVKNAWDFARGEPPPSFHSKETTPANYRRIRELARVVVPGHDRPFELLPGGDLRYVRGGDAVKLELYADPAEPPSPITLLAGGEPLGAS